MKVDSVWTGLVYAFHLLTFSPVDDESSQQPLLKEGSGNAIIHHDGSPEAITPIAPDEHAEVSFVDNDDIPVVDPPKSPQEGKAGGLKCRYPEMTGWEPCYGPSNRTCWLKKKDGSERKDIDTDYENPQEVPVGVTRQYYLELNEEPISPDGATMEHGKLFNRTYPGPWIEACWGDTLEITVKNNLQWNGTSVHWHGLRQLNASEHDGVNGITQCPIPPGETYTYTFRVYQYGSAWYHSHYSLQYGDGTLGPLTIYGPSTANFDSQQAFRPLLMTDWNHRSVFEDWPIMLKKGAAPYMTNILLNGTGQFGFDRLPDKYTLYLKKDQKHMLILINTSVDTTFVFSIDDHVLEVVEMDFVPIEPYNTTNIKVAIGQRYHVIVHGLENPYEKERFGNYWMRVVPARKCSKFAYGPDDQMGIIRYDESVPPKELNDPLSEPPLYDINCADEPYKNLTPWRKWTVKDPINIDPHKDHSSLSNNSKYIFDIGMRDTGGPGTNTPYIPNDKNYTRWQMHTAPFRINFSDPTLLALNHSDKLIEQPHLDIVSYDNKHPQERLSDRWVWMILTAPDKVPPGGEGFFVPAAHPMHLHGHDFAILRQSHDNFYYRDEKHPGDIQKLTPSLLNCNNTLLNCDNPPRRDVALLPASGYMVIAFKADNPGVWIMHCHIAFHASSGLAIQVIEDKQLIDATMNKTQNEETCRKWVKWYSNPMNHWDMRRPDEFQDDSGV